MTTMNEVPALQRLAVNYDDLVGIPMPDESASRLTFVATPGAIWDAASSCCRRALASPAHPDGKYPPYTGAWRQRSLLPGRPRPAKARRDFMRRVWPA